MAPPSPRRKDALAVHSLQRFVFSVPDLREAAKFYRAFGLDVREIDGRLDLYAFGHPHRWGSIYQRPGGKRLEYVALGAYAEDFDALVKRLGDARRADDPAASRLPTTRACGSPTPKGSPSRSSAPTRSRRSGHRDPAAERFERQGAAPARSQGAAPTRPRRLSHILMFTSDVLRSVRFYCDALGLRLSDHSGDIIAFMHGAHGSDHHMLAFAKSDGPGLHHSSWDVPTIDAVGIGMEQMARGGLSRDGWGVGRHVIGSNYFRYVRDPWGSFAEYSADIDFIPADVDWKAADHPPEDSFYVWGPPVPDYFIQQSRDRGAT